MKQVFRCCCQDGCGARGLQLQGGLARRRLRRKDQLRPSLRRRQVQRQTHYNFTGKSNNKHITTLQASPNFEIYSFIRGRFNKSFRLQMQGQNITNLKVKVNTYDMKSLIVLHSTDVKLKI